MPEPAALVRAGWLEEEAATAMLAWPHSGFGAHVGPAIAGGDREGLLRVARYGAHAPVAESRLRYTPSAPRPVWWRRRGVMLVPAPERGPGAHEPAANWPARRSAVVKPADGSEVVAHRLLGGLHHRYEWCTAA